ncbi:hypothetical protein PUNSTDRAFT_139057 [Punctularia strigosozonata HHB-11173 SS5]|uniref:Distal membrane-arm assembly complex protein 1-like domain-containing protein n=1 Tax=Punctularia strigosozonata (strain HHB-11173) TaxID=741275 RepID=R7S0V3_PUNST|nr:uncharacterized protein PUNSTDRAFT_139057 [Punctularia strigosozonata HHB-11173 SS5]EIN04015.1 hypothetical protein PUNSTDRAFT_139057 [Punctularia strigosozonata HHB-11173 SS5]
MSATGPPASTEPLEDRPHPQQCLACRVIGTAALGGVGLYALQMSRASAPGSPLGKRIVGGVGFGFLIASYLRWAQG